ncbi:MAG: replication/maintenance protein RepL [Lachnospiraceae bacterium]|nr:replication/maintenance protein RepL [Ruminococcus sp.]MCM1275633.1 replication/maintenance protein RepL [Lachnospiraceae bacterium]
MNSKAFTEIGDSTKFEEEYPMPDEAKSPYDRWVQMNLAHVRDWVLLTRNNHVAAEVLWFLIDNSDRYNAVVCSSTVLEEALGYSRITISKAIKYLKENQFVEIKKSGTTNVYLINKEISWKSWGKNFKYAKFGASVLISESEQNNCEDTAVSRVNMVELKGKIKPTL